MFRPVLVLRRVSGDSMLPVLRPGQIVVAAGARRCQVDDIIIIRHNGLDKIKRLSDRRMQGSGDEIYVRGDNAADSTDSRQFGWLPANVIQGKVIWPRIHKKKKRYTQK